MIGMGGIIIAGALDRDPFRKKKRSTTRKEKGGSRVERLYVYMPRDDKEGKKREEWIYRVIIKMLSSFWIFHPESSPMGMTNKLPSFVISPERAA